MDTRTPIILSRLDVERVEALLETPALKDSSVARKLHEQFDRAEIVEPSQMPHDVVSMNSSAECVEEFGNKHHSLTLVYPKDADADAGRISVLAPVGSAVLGLRVGQSIDWLGHGGRRLKLRVTAIQYQPEAAGDLHR